ncbi:hypothetical protein V6N11_062378 [Hibiscus sabdariffa]|uniref:Dynein light chain n=1 Tax=Hibiscus sabdariffa TaxID=183260 RepID=A0ABR2PSD9_9ROSI
MLKGKALIKETDMPEKMQTQAMDSASQALDFYDVSDCISIAAHIKKEFDKKYGGGWQCVGNKLDECFCSSAPAKSYVQIKAVAYRFMAIGKLHQHQKWCLNKTYKDGA